MPRKGILIIGNPRSVNTALERYFIRRNDFTICHEPVTQHIFSTHNEFIKSPYHPKATSSEILFQVNKANPEGNFLIREMAWAVHDADFIDNLPPDIQVILVFREPEQAVLSHEKYYQINKELEKQQSADFTSFHSTGRVMDYDLIQNIYRRLKAQGKKPILIDADDLASNSERVIEKLCFKLGIEFDKEHLQWEAGECKLWPYTKDTWQKEVTESTGFMPLRNAHKLSSLSLDEQTKLQKLINKNQPIYSSLMRCKL